MASPDDFEPWVRRWSLIADGEGFTTRFGSRLLPVLADGEPAMLKIAGHEEERRGVLAYAGLGAAWSLESGHEADARCGLDIADAAVALI
jgi:streptomycin 6-kinase